LVEYVYRLSISINLRVNAFKPALFTNLLGKAILEIILLPIKKLFGTFCSMNVEEVLFREAEQFNWPSIFKSFLPARKTLSGVGTAVIAYFLVLLFMHLPKEYWGRLKVDPAVAGIIPIGLLLVFWMKNPGKLIVLKAPSWVGILIAMVVGFALIPVMAQLSLLDGKAEVFKNLFDQLQKGNLGVQGSVSLGPIAILSFLILPLIYSESAVLMYFLIYKFELRFC
jgi:hypothetical protein